MSRNKIVQILVCKVTENEVTIEFERKRAKHPTAHNWNLRWEYTFTQISAPKAEKYLRMIAALCDVTETHIGIVSGGLQIVFTPKNPNILIEKERIWQLFLNADFESTYGDPIKAESMYDKALQDETNWLLTYQETVAPTAFYINNGTLIRARAAKARLAP